MNDISVDMSRYVNGEGCVLNCYVASLVNVRVCKHCETVWQT